MKTLILSLIAILLLYSACCGIQVCECWEVYMPERMADFLQSGSYMNDQRWDLNNDGVTNLKDFAIVANQSE